MSGHSVTGSHPDAHAIDLSSAVVLDPSLFSVIPVDMGNHQHHVQQNQPIYILLQSPGVPVHSGTFSSTPTTPTTPTDGPTANHGQLPSHRTGGRRAHLRCHKCGGFGHKAKRCFGQQQSPLGSVTSVAFEGHTTDTPTSAGNTPTTLAQCVGSPDSFGGIAHSVGAVGNPTTPATPFSDASPSSVPMTPGTSIVLSSRTLGCGSHPMLDVGLGGLRGIDALPPSLEAARRYSQVSTSNVSAPTPTPHRSAIPPPSPVD
eukprot:PhM_4_TR2416/c0_g1_i1/m.74403